MEPKKTERANVERYRGNFLLLGLILSTVFVIVAFSWKSYDEVDAQLESDIKVPDESQVAEVTKQKKKKPKTPAPPEIEVVEDDVEIDEDQADVQSADMVESDELSLPSGQGEKEKKEDKIFVSVQEEPQFPGGKEKMFDYIRSNLSYPRQAKEAGIEGTVFVNFVVNKDGSISRVKVRKGVNKALNQEAIRVVKSMPNWNPGRQRGKPVRATFLLPIRFSLGG